MRAYFIQNLLMVLGLLVMSVPVPAHAHLPSTTVSSAPNTFITSNEPPYLELVGQFGGSTTVVTVQGYYAYVGEGSQLIVLDISNPAEPVLVGRVSGFLGSLSNITIFGDIAYIEEGGIHILDISDPTNPTQIGFYPHGSNYSFSEDGKYAYGIRLPEVYILDLSNPTAPVKVAAHTFTHTITYVKAVGNYLHVALHVPKMNRGDPRRLQ